MKKQKISRENIFSSVGRVTVVVYLKVGTEKQTLSTILYADKSQFVPGISAQMTYRPGHGRTLDEAVKNIIARTVAKYETACRPQREHIDYAQAYRSFTDPTGQQYLYSKLCRDRHGCPAPEKENTRTSIVQLPDGRQEIRIPPVSGSSCQGDALITLTLTNVQPGDVIEAHAPGGCFLDISSE